MTPEEADAKVLQHAERIRDLMNEIISEGAFAENPDGNPYATTGVTVFLRDSAGVTHQASAVVGNKLGDGLWVAVLGEPGEYA